MRQFFPVGSEAVVPLLILPVVLAGLCGFDTAYADPEAPKWIAIAGLAVLCAALMARSSFIDAIATVDIYDVLALLLAGYAAASLLWTPDPQTGFLFLTKLAMLAAIFRYIKNHGTVPVFWAVCGAVGVSVAIIMAVAWQTASAWGGFFNRNYITEYLLAAVPFVSALLAVRRVIAKGVAVLLIGAMVWYLGAENPSKIEFFVVPAGALVLLWVSAASRRIQLAVGLGLAALVAGTFVAGWDFLAATKGFRYSVWVRLGFYYDALMAWLDAPLLGHGAGSFEALSPLYKERHLAVIRDPGAVFFDTSFATGAAHNEFLQLAVDLGAVGAGIAAVFIGVLLRGFSASNRKGVIAWCGMGTVALTLPNMLINFPLQNPATALLAALGCGWVANQCRAGSRVYRCPLPAARYAAVVLAVAWGMALIVGSIRFESGERLRRLATDVHFAYRPERSYRLMEKAYAAFPFSRDNRMQLHLSLINWYADYPIINVPPAEFDRVFGIARSASLYYAPLLTTRLEYLLQSGRYRERLEEVESHLRILKASSANFVDVYMLEATFATLAGDYPRARAAVAHARSILLRMTLRAEQGMEGNRAAAAAVGDLAASRNVADPAGAPAMILYVRDKEQELRRLEGVLGP